MFDEAGNIWPPGFKSRLTDRTDPLSMLPRNVSGETQSQVATRSREQGVRDGVHSAIGRMGAFSNAEQKVLAHRPHIPDRGKVKGFGR